MWAKILEKYLGRWESKEVAKPFFPQLNDVTENVQKGSLVFVPAGTKHNFKNTGTDSLKLYTVYAPSEHAPGTVHKTKAEAEAAEGH